MRAHPAPFSGSIRSICTVCYYFLCTFFVLSDIVFAFLLPHAPSHMHSHIYHLFLTETFIGLGKEASEVYSIRHVDCWLRVMTSKRISVNICIINSQLIFYMHDLLIALYEEVSVSRVSPKNGLDSLLFSNFTKELGYDRATKLKFTKEKTVNQNMHRELKMFVPTSWLHPRLSP